MTDLAQEQQRVWTRAEVEARVGEILVESLGVAETEVTPAASLVRDLGAESIDFLDIGFKIQQVLGVNLHTAEIRDRVMAWGALVHPTLAALITERYGVPMTVEELRGLEKGGLTAALGQVASRKSGEVLPGAVDELGRALVDRLVQEFAVLGCAVGEKDQVDLLAIMRSDLSTRKLTERTLDLLTVDALVGFVCAKLGPRLAGA
jgi:acyl carrier protein